MSPTSTASWAVRITMRSRIWALVSGRALGCEAPAATGAARCASLAIAAGAPGATAAAGTAIADEDAGTAPGATAFEPAVAGVLVGAAAGCTNELAALQATPPTITSSAPSTAKRVRKRRFFHNIAALRASRATGPTEERR